MKAMKEEKTVAKFFRNMEEDMYQEQELVAGYAEAVNAIEIPLLQVVLTGDGK